MLKPGDRGIAVAEMQRFLKDLGYDLGRAGVDGIYGKMTTAAVKKFQADNRLNPTGVADWTTINLLAGKWWVRKGKTASASKEVRKFLDLVKKHEQAKTLIAKDKAKPIQKYLGLSLSTWAFIGIGAIAISLFLARD